MGAGQAAQTAKRSPEFSATYAGISRRRGKKVATIAISRKLLTRATTCSPPRPSRHQARRAPPKYPRKPEGHQAPGELAIAA